MGRTEVYIKTSLGWKLQDAKVKNITTSTWDTFSDKTIPFNITNKLNGATLENENYQYHFEGGVPERVSKTISEDPQGNVDIRGDGEIEVSDDTSAGGDNSAHNYVTCTVTYYYGEQFVEDTFEALTRRTWMCLAEGTLITLADKTQKPIEDIRYDDELLVWNFDEGKFDIAKPSVIFKPASTNKYNHLVFNDGSYLDTVNQHRIYNCDSDKFTYPMTDDTPIGTTTFNDKGDQIKLTSKEVIEKPIEYYNIITENHFNLFANTILTSCRLNNLYKIKNMQFIKDDRSIKPKSDFPNLTDYEYRVFRAGEQPVDINNNSVNFGDNSVEDYIIRCRNSAKKNI